MMTRKKCIAMLPIIQAFAAGEHIQYYDNTNIENDRWVGRWVTAEDIGFGMPVHYYRAIRNGEPFYFTESNPFK